jgi:tRNA-Thr(GGU) m(6)t(6)A37 methyltransferase TsaA
MAGLRFIGSVTGVQGEESKVKIYDEYCSGLLGIDEYSHIILLYWLHERDDEKNRNVLQVYPHRHSVKSLRGVYACRSPSRPNPIGLTIVELLKVEGCELTVKGLDALKGSPIIDIKPYSTRSDCYPNARIPDWSKQGPPS